MNAHPILRLLSAAALFAAPVPLPAQTPSDLTTRVAEARAFATGPGEAVWPGYGAAPFSLLITEPERELLLCRPSAPSGFEPVDPDAATGCEAYSRPRSDLPDTLLSAMPIFGPPSTIVVARRPLPVSAPPPGPASFCTSISTSGSPACPATTTASRPSTSRAATRPACGC